MRAGRGAALTLVTCSCDIIGSDRMICESKAACAQVGVPKTDSAGIRPSQKISEMSHRDLRGPGAKRCDLISCGAKRCELEF